MPRKTKDYETDSIIGSRIIRYRVAYNLTQADLADRYKVSGPAIFKFEKGFVTPSLGLWMKIAKDIGIPEGEAVLLWIQEKLPQKKKCFVPDYCGLDLDAFLEELRSLSKKPNAQDAMRKAILGNADVSPSLKRFVADNTIWDTLKPTCVEVECLVRLSLEYPLITVEQYLDAIMIGRSIQNPGE
jgi:transcriptional regulator with XRE-family HTH domain